MSGWQVHIKPLLQQLLDGSISEKEMSKLVQLSRSIIQAYLINIRSSLTCLCFTQGITITDLAYDCVADAFARDQSNSYPKLENFIQSLRGPLEQMPDIEVFLAFKAFIFRVGNAELARLYAHSDPSGSKIYRNIKETVKKSHRFSLAKDSSGFYLKTSDCDGLESRGPFPFDELKQVFFHSMDGKRSTPELLDILYKVLTSQTTYRRSVLILDVTRLLKEIYHGEITEEAEGTGTLHLEELTSFDIDQIRNRVESTIKEKIVLTYFAKNKINRKQAEALYKAFQDIFDDWCQGGDSETSLYRYFNKYFGCKMEFYESEFRTKMEYLLKIAREEFRIGLLREI